MAIVEIPLTRGKVAIVDEQDAPLALQFKWHACNRKTTWYAGSSHGRFFGGKGLYLHRVLMEPAEGQHVDHINGNGLDCRRENMRLCTVTENRRNKRKTHGASRFKGVQRNKTRVSRPWCAKITVNYACLWLGSYATEEEAAVAYNEAAMKHFGEFARLNEVPLMTVGEKRP